MKKISISIPKPCHQNWSTMLQEEKGKFCESCAKTVVDFTTSSDQEIADYFTLNLALKTCGRFKKNQLESIKIEIPEHIIYQQTTFKKSFLLALFIVMGTTLFSCKDQNNTIQNLGEVVVIQDCVLNSKEAFIKPLKFKDSVVKKGEVNSKKLIPSPPIHLLGITVVEPIIKSEILTGEVIILPLKTETPKTYNLAEVEKKPVFCDAENEFQKYLSQNLIIDGDVEPFTVIVEFVINSKGGLENIKIWKGKNAKINTQITDILQNLPLWKPGEIRGEMVNVKMTYPIRIKPQ